MGGPNRKKSRSTASHTTSQRRLGTRAGAIDEVDVEILRALAEYAAKVEFLIG